MKRGSERVATGKSRRTIGHKLICIRDMIGTIISKFMKQFIDKLTDIERPTGLLLMTVCSTD